MRRAAWGLVAAALAWCAIPKPPLREGLSLSQAVYDRDGRLLHLTLTEDQRYRLWLPLEVIAPAMAEAAVLEEDRWFRWHPGVNPASLARAFRLTYLGGGRRVGGSTITMQVARMRYGIRSRSVAGKLRQIARALQLELRCSKNEILEAYLNLIPLGGNIEGVGAASLVYFGHDAGRLTPAEALALSLVPKSPASRSPAREASPALAAARRRALARWVRRHPEDARRAAELSALAAQPKTLAFLAPHFADTVAREHPVEAVIHSTLDLGLQASVERQARAYVEERRREGIRNAAALVVDYGSMEVRAALGSADFFDASIQGQVDGTRARRSPGSALKPFIYALAMDQGLLHPQTMLKDAPASFGGYNPENFDRDFLGPVSARDALIRSRNVPAVLAATRLSSPTLHAFLGAAGVGGLREEAHYGAALALGGAEMTMAELVRLYAMLANGGALRGLRTRLEDPREEGPRLLSEDASFMTLDMLKDAPRPGQAWRQDWTLDRLAVPWKTGTSFGFRDAWSVGIAGPYVVAVWVGNFDGEGNPAFVGAEAAAPLMFRIVDALKAREPLRPAGTWAPREVRRVAVCAVSGSLPGPACPRKAKTWYIPGRSPIGRCEVHRAVLVDARTGLRACREGPGTRLEVHEFWPSDLLGVFARAGIPRRPPPAEDPACGLEARAAAGAAPHIADPPAGVSIALRAGSVGRQQVPLSAVTDGDARELHWFADGRYLGRAKAGTPLLWAASPGRRLLRAVDDHGRSDAREVLVTVVP